MVTEKMMTRLTDAIRDADQRQAYWQDYADKVRGREQWSALASLFLVAMAAFLVLGDWHWGVDAVSVIAAFFATALPVVRRWNGAAARCAMLHARFYRFMVDYESLLVRVRCDESMSDLDVDAILAPLLKAEADLGADATAEFSEDVEMSERLETEVSKARGYVVSLDSPPESGEPSGRAKENRQHEAS